MNFKGGRPIFGGVRGEYNGKEVVEEFDSMESWRVAYGLPNAGDNGGVGEDAEDEAYSYTLLISSSQRRDTRRPVEVLMVQWLSGAVWIGVVIVTDIIEHAIIIPEKTIRKLLLNKKICLSMLSKETAGGRYVIVTVVVVVAGGVLSDKDDVRCNSFLFLSFFRSLQSDGIVDRCVCNGGELVGRAQ